MAGLTWHRTRLGLGSSWLVACDCFCKLLPGGPSLKCIWLQGGGLFVFYPPSVEHFRASGHGT